MNVFVLDRDPKQAARDLCDKHVVKMALESTQLLCTAAHSLGFPAPYRATHKHHPCNVWLLQGYENFYWLFRHTVGIFGEYSRRYGRSHASNVAMRTLLAGAPLSAIERALPPGSTPFAQAMPETYKREDAVDAYRAYYLGEKVRFATWREPATPPAWWVPRAAA